MLRIAWVVVVILWVSAAGVVQADAPRIIFVLDGSGSMMGRVVDGQLWQTAVQE